MGDKTLLYIWVGFLVTQIQEHRAAIEYQQGGIEAKQVEHQQVLDQFPFYGEPSSLLQLATIPQQFHSYQLQLAQPNLQDSNV